MLNVPSKGGFVEGGEGKQMFETVGFSALQLGFICYWFKSSPRAQRALFRHSLGYKKTVRFSLKIGFLFSRIPKTNSLCVAYPKIDTSEPRLKSTVSRDQRKGKRQIVLQSYWTLFEWFVLCVDVARDAGINVGSLWLSPHKNMNCFNMYFTANDKPLPIHHIANPTCKKKKNTNE